jgi:hypothetical protein
MRARLVKWAPGAAAARRMSPSGAAPGAARAAASEAAQAPPPPRLHPRAAAVLEFWCAAAASRAPDRRRTPPPPARSRPRRRRAALPRLGADLLAAALAAPASPAAAAQLFEWPPPERHALWWRGGTDADDRVRAAFGPDLEDLAAGRREAWGDAGGAAHPLETLAGVIACDQFSRCGCGAARPGVLGAARSCAPARRRPTRASSPHLPGPPLCPPSTAQQRVPRQRPGVCAGRQGPGLGAAAAGHRGGARMAPGAEGAARAGRAPRWGIGREIRRAERPNACCLTCPPAPLAPAPQMWLFL